MLYPPQTTEGLKTDWGGLVDARGVVEKNGKSRNRRWTIVDLVIKGIRAWIVWRCPPLNCLRQMHPPPLHSHPQVPNLCIFETVFCKQYYFPKKSEPSFRQGKRIVYLDFWGVLPKKYEVSLANIWLSLLHLTFCTLYIWSRPQKNTFASWYPHFRTSCVPCIQDRAPDIPCWVFISKFMQRNLR